ncbi:MAG: AraC family transcriptional regulator [Desulfovibrionaceae bacterium]|nr:AraC family transcriptional regulator [Desulfovibrionaceae bacterium]
MAAETRTDLERMNRLLKEKILGYLPHPGKYQTDIRGLSLSRREAENQADSCFGRPSAAIVVQGAKCAVIGATEYRYGANQCLVTGVDMPSAFYILEPSPEKPFLAIALDLDGYLLTQLAAEVPESAGGDTHNTCSGVSVADADADLVGAFLRLLELQEKPGQIAVRAPMIVREIHYLLLIGPQGRSLRQLNTLGTQSNQIYKSVAWLKENFRTSLKIDDLAHYVNMVTSTFYHHFKVVTGLSPLQYHKRLRLYEAQRLMMTEGCNAGEAAVAVGYESETQFNREYKRLFGEPPRRDVVRRCSLLTRQA